MTSRTKTLIVVALLLLAVAIASKVWRRNQASKQMTVRPAPHATSSPPGGDLP